MAVNKKLIYKWVLICSITLNVITLGYFIDRKVIFGYLRAKRFENQKWEVLYRTKTDSTEIIFIGTSLTAGFALQSSFNNTHLKNMGFGGLESGAILRNLKRIITRKPPKIFLESGINDVRNSKDMNLAYQNFVQMCVAAKTISPATKLYVQSVLPTLTPLFNTKIMDYNARVKNYCAQNKINYIDMYATFLQEGRLNAMATTDGVHLTPYGYYLWKKQLEKYIAE